MFIVLVLLIMPSSVKANSGFSCEQDRLERGDVIIGESNGGGKKFVVAKILINAPPERVWPVLTNPFEFPRKISPHMKDVVVLTDKADLSVLKVTIDLGFFLPHITYAVESRYEPDGRIDFKRVGGNIKDFKGFWIVSRAGDGKQTEVVYSMYINPGLPVPQWIIRAGVREELPHTLIAMRNRVMSIYIHGQPPATPTILAASCNGHFHI